MAVGALAPLGLDDARVVHEGVELAGLTRQAAHLFELGQVRDEAGLGAHLLRDVLDLAGVAAVHQHPGAAGSELRRHAPAEPVRRARDEDALLADRPHRRRLTTSTMNATSSTPAASCAASETPRPSSSAALRIAENSSEAPKKTTSVQRTVLRSTAEHDSRGSLVSTA
jgi:hypothetical protein